MQLPPRAWQWPNLIAFDAALIAVAWQAAFAKHFALPLNQAAYVVLGLSVWLTYMADRLFDVANRPANQLHSARHRFAKKNTQKLWIIWIAVLIGDLAIAFNHLATNQLINGCVLLTVCLLYTLLNQLLSRRFFPKEICVALIYAGGVIVFLPPPFPWLATCACALLCLINCLIIGAKEHAIDATMQVRSITQIMSGYLVPVLCVAALLPLAFMDIALAVAIGSSLAFIVVIQFYQMRIRIETFRVLADSALFIGPVMLLLL
jgi:hypothetical protein